MESTFIENLREERYERQEQERRRKLKLYTLGGTLITSATLAAQLFSGAVIKPLDAGYVFTSDDVVITGETEDYHTKAYTVRDSNGRVNNFTFDELEKIEPNVNGGYTYIPDEYLQAGSHLGIQRVENNPVKKVVDGAALMAFVGGAALTGYSIKEQMENSGRRR